MHFVTGSDVCVMTSASVYICFEIYIYIVCTLENGARHLINSHLSLPFESRLRGLQSAALLPLWLLLPFRYISCQKGKHRATHCSPRSNVDRTHKHTRATAGRAPDEKPKATSSGADASQAKRLDAWVSSGPHPVVGADGRLGN